MFPDNLTRAEAQARSALIRTHRYTIEVDLSGQRVPDPETTFGSTSVVGFQARRDGTLHVDLIADSVVEAYLDGEPLDPASFADSRLPLRVDAGQHELSVRAICRYSRTGEGLHRFVDPADDRTYLYTQFEPAEARRVFACFEQPDLKARFAISVLTSDDAWTVVSNGAPTSRTTGVGGTTRWVFGETEPISTYLTALVAGDYHIETHEFDAAAGRLPMAILCRRSLAEHLDARRIFDTTTQGFEVFERHFDTPYPFGKYDQVFVPEYNGGAMENVGCVTLRDEYVFRSRATPASYQVRDDTILHELSHMWFGDLVTMRWWDDLWLKESFATWASNFASSEIADDPATAWASFANGFKTWAYRQDQLPSTHPIAADIVDLEAVEQNFDGITYSKGASVLVQLVYFVGQHAFLEGLRGYFRRHAYGNTDLADLLSALEQASGRDLRTWSAQWLETTGVNSIRPRFALGADDTFSKFVVEQSADPDHPTLRSHRIAVGLYQLTGDALRRIGRVETDIDGAETPIPELVGLRQPDLVLLNDDDLSYAKVRLDPASLRTVISHIHRLESPLARAVCWNATWDMCRDAELPATDYIDLVLRGVAVESDHTAVRTTLGQAMSAARHYTPLVSRTQVLRRWQDGVTQLLDTARPGSDHQLALAMALPGAAQDDVVAERLLGWLSGEGVPEGLAIDPELRWTVVVNLARLGRLEDSQIAAELGRDNTITGAEQAAAARAARPTAEAKAEAWRLAVETDTIPNGMQREICLAFWQRGQDEVLRPYVEAYLTAAKDISAGHGIWAQKGMALRTSVLRYLFPVPRELEPFVARLDEWLGGHELTETVRRPIIEARDNALRALRCQRAAAGST